MAGLAAACSRSVALVAAWLLLGAIGPPPDPADESDAPLRVTLVAAETRPFQGLTAIQDDQYGKVYPEGARTRLLLQAADATAIIEVDHIHIKVRKLAVRDRQRLAYAIDPLKQPGFGPAAPRKFNVVLDGETRGVVNYTDEHATAHPAIFPDLLPTDLPLLRLDAQSGLQETLDLNLKATTEGLYEIQFEVIFLAGERQYARIAGPVRLFKE